jgi:K+-sensing histidine kinase KdpD
MTSQPPADVAAAADVVAKAAPIVALRPSAGGLSWTRRWAGLLIVALGLPLLTAVLVAARSDLSVQSMLLIYLLAVVVVAVVGGVVPALLSAVASFFLVNWFLTPPYYTLAVESREAAIDLVVFVLAAILVSVTVELGARNREAAERIRVESRLISQLSSAEISQASLMAVLEQVRGLFGMSTVALAAPHPDRGRHRRPAAPGLRARDLRRGSATARCACRHGQPSVAGPAAGRTGGASPSARRDRPGPFSAARRSGP